MARFWGEADLAYRAGQYLKNELEKRHLTQARFAEMMGVEDRTVRRWISDGVNRLDVLSDIMDTLGINILRDISSDEEDDAPSHFLWAKAGRRAERQIFYIHA